MFCYIISILQFLRAVKWNCRLLLRAERSPMQICIDDEKTFFLQLEMFLVGAGITSTEKTHPPQARAGEGGGDDSER